MNLQDTLNSLVGREGGYTNNPNDRGGETNWGITALVARAFGYSGSMQLMPKETAISIYRDRFWIQPHFDQIAMIDPNIAEELLDTGVNMGPATAGKFLQRALNVLNQDQRSFPNLTVDGGIGKMTIAALKAFLQVRGSDGKTVLLRMLNAQQSVRYMEIAEANTSQEDFEFGWQLNRIGEL